MFKKAPHLKPSTPLKNSDRRRLLSSLQTAYPSLVDAPSEVTAQLVPDGLRSGAAVTSGGEKATIYTDPNARPLWFSLGANAGSAKGREVEVIPTVYALWIYPSLLPRLPTWPQVLDPALVGGSALMAPGLLPSPHTFPTSSSQPLPSQHSLLSITAYPSPVPLVVARAEMGVEEMIRVRKAGGKGKAAKVIHSWKDALWEMGGKGAPPTVDVDQELANEAEKTLAGVTEEQENGDEAQQGERELANRETREERHVVEPGPGETADADNEERDASVGLSPNDVDTILRLALVSSLSSHLSKAPSSTFPMPASSLYSTYILPNRPSTLPPSPAKGRSGPRLEEGESVKEVRADVADVKKSSHKKLAKWVKAMEKEDLLKSKDVRGELVIVEVNAQHPDVRSITPFRTLAAVAAQTGPTTDAATEGGAGGAGAAGPAGPSRRTEVVVERFLQPTGQAVKFFQEIGQSTSGYYTRAQLRDLLLGYISSNSLVSATDASQIRLDPILAHALFPKSATLPPDTLRRDQALERLCASCTDMHRVSRLLPVHVAAVNKGATFGATAGEKAMEMELDGEVEEVGPVRRGLCAAVKVEIKQRQGRKTVTLVTGLENFGVDPKEVGGELMRSVGASASVSALPSSTPKQPKAEVFVQGDQRKALTEMLAKRYGLDKRWVEVRDGVAEKKKKEKK